MGGVVLEVEVAKEYEVIEFMGIGSIEGIWLFDFRFPQRRSSEVMSVIASAKFGVASSEGSTSSGSSGMGTLAGSIGVS